ncbi:MAG TPA: hypothetical protein VGB45_08705 [Abditibacterium sp.]|jgi:hypothetical protein
MNNDKKLFTERATERAALMLKSNPKMLRSQALRMAAQELTHYLVSSLEARSGVYRVTLGEAEATAATLRSAGFNDVTITPPEFAASVLEKTP